MLGSFTSGLFGGASDVMSLTQNYQKIKQQRRMDEAADSVQKQIEAGGGDKTMPQIQSAAPAAGQSAAAPTSFDDDPELKKVSYGRGTSPREDKAFGGTPQAIPAGSMSTAPVDTVKDTSPAKSLLPPIAAPGSTSWSWDKGPHIKREPDATAPIPPAGTGTGTRPPQAIPVAPQYLAPAATAPIPPPGTAEAPIPPPIPPATQKPPVVPTLGNSMSGLGSQILAAMNPTAGATV